MGISRSGSSLHCFQLDLEFGNVVANGDGDANVLADNIVVIHQSICL